MFTLMKESGFEKVRAAVVPGFRFKAGGTKDAAESYGVKAIMMTAVKPV